MLGRAFCAVMVAAALSTWSVAGAADTAPMGTDPHQVEPDSHGEAGGASHAHVGHKGVTEDVSSFSIGLATYTAIVFIGLCGLLYKFA